MSIVIVLTHANTYTNTLLEYQRTNQMCCQPFDTHLTKQDLLISQLNSSCQGALNRLLQLYLKAQDRSFTCNTICPSIERSPVYQLRSISCKNSQTSKQSTDNLTFSSRMFLFAITILSQDRYRWIQWKYQFCCDNICLATTVSESI